MNVEKYGIVVTTINHPTRAVEEILRDTPKLDASFYIIGDTKSPPSFSAPGSIYLDIPAQEQSGFAFGRLAPTRHYARKNVGYLQAARDGCTVIIETDDDNIPLADFWLPRTRMVEGDLVSEPGWVNAYRYFTDALIWPRGLPLDAIHSIAPESRPADGSLVDCPIQQGLADRNPDVDAIYRLVLPLPLDFLPDRTVVLDRDVWCPFNSQNTTWWREAFPLLYLPSHCSFRMTDIWRSFVAQRICWENGGRLMFHSSTVFQERNEHNLMHDFRDEVPGYLHNDSIKKTLEGLSLQAGVRHLGANLRVCYAALVELGVVGSEELPLIDAWNQDFEGLPTP